MAVANFAPADTIRGIDINFVTIGNAGNAADTQVMTTDGTTGYGAVGYNYRIGKYEVTNAQWNAFTAAAGAPTGNDGGYDYNSVYTGAQQPTNNAYWYEAAQFCNYLTSGDKSKGAYLFSGNNTNPGYFQGIYREAAQTTYGTIYVIPTENEWYKAAYHKNDGVTGNYWLYPTQSNSAPSNDLINPDPGNNANFWDGEDHTIGSPDYLTPVGEFENSDSAYGTFDQGGNVYEWNEALIYGSWRVLRGGSYYDCLVAALASSYRGADHPDIGWGYGIGFRVAEVPEPASAFLIICGAALLRLHNRKR
jgi:formylglycine-generating enzyme required for sulfatase activity